MFFYPVDNRISQFFLKTKQNKKPNKTKFKFPLRECKTETTILLSVEQYSVTNLKDGKSALEIIFNEFSLF